MPNKKSEDQERPEVPTELETRVDSMMSVEKERKTDVSKLAADFNKQLMSEKPVTGKVEVKASAPPELPEEMKVPEDSMQPDDPAHEADETPETTPQPDEEVSAADSPKPASEFDDQATNKAVDEIVAEEGDTLLAVEDARRNKINASVVSKSWKDKLKAFFKSRWTWAGILLILVVLFSVPATRYKILGLFIKKSVTVTVIDSKTSSPVSSAQVSLGNDSVKTNQDGKAELSTGLGSHKLLVSKKYYTDLNTNYFVGFRASPASRVKLVATGRLVPVKVINKITGKPLSGVQVYSEGTSAKTNSKGEAEVALPVKAATYQGRLVLKGYNTAQITIQVTDKSVKENSFGLTPAGQVYFLSNLNGSLDVVKSNLDGTGRKTVLEGTGHEEPSATSLLASRDWRYLVLKSRRDTGQAALYLIDTTTDKVTSFDNNNADFTLIGWYDHSFVYSLTKNNSQYWQTGRQIIKSYDADHLQLNQLDQTQAEGNEAGYAYQNFSNFYILNGAVSYSTQWYSYNYDAGGKNDTVRAIQPNGQNKKDYQTFPASSTGYIQASLYEPQAVYYGVYDNSTGKTSYYEFENLAVKPASISQSEIDQGYPTYLLSPSGNKTFWAELRDGKNSLFVGGPNADGKKQTASLSSYAPYGWYGDSYVLVSKNSSELYVMSPAASSEPPLKITDYYKPAQTYQGYGYGYGGL